LISWGLDPWGTNRGSQFAPPNYFNDVVAIAAGEMHYLALKKGGTVLVWGEKRYGALNMPEDLSHVVAVVAACGNNSLALKEDGTMVGWGQSIKIPHGLSNIVAISSSPESRLGIGQQGNALALKQDGTVIYVDWSDNQSKANVIAGLSNVVAIAAGPVHNLALKKDGTVFAWGFNGNGELNQPPGLTNVVAIAASGSSFPADGYSLALKGDGQILAWGRMNYRPVTVPAGLSNVVAISAGPGFCLAITTNLAVAEHFRQK
jgi:alpha-tubulin suppressor-like RCC1 family protein